MRAIVFLLGLSLLSASVESTAFVDEAASGKPQPAHVRHETVSLDDLLEAVSRKSGKEFLVDKRAPAEVVVGTVAVRDVDYAMLLSILKNNALAAAPDDNATKIVPVSVVRQYAIPTIRETDDSIPADAWVTRVVAMQNAPAVGLVPLLRPMIQREGHLVAVTNANLLIIVATYSVAERLASIANDVDERATPPAGETPDQQTQD